MDMHEENLSQFSLLAADAVDELWSLIASNASIEAEDGVQLSQLQQYIEIMQRLADFATSSELTGLETVCTLVEANLQTVSSEGRGLTNTEFKQLAEWPELLMGYIISKGDETSANLLIQNMESTSWPLPMSVDDSEMLKMMLVISSPAAEVVQPVYTHQAENPEELQPYTFEGISSLVEEPVPPAGDLPPSGLQEVSSEMINMLSKEFALMSEQISEDLAAAVSMHFSEQERRVALANYTELIERLGVASESIGLVVLARVFERFKMILSDIQNDLSPAQHSLLEQLPGRVAAYLAWSTDESSCSALIDLLTDAAWHAPISQGDAQIWIHSTQH